VLERQSCKYYYIESEICVCSILYYHLTWAKYELAMPYVSASPGTRRATKLWRRTITLGGPGSRAVSTSHRACAPVCPGTPVAVDF